MTLVSENLTGEAAKRDEPEMADSPGPASPVSNALSLLTVTSRASWKVVKALMMCDHPLAMKIRSDPDDPAEGLGS